MIPAASYLASLGNAAARSLLVAGAVGCGLWALRVRNVMAQKTAWILVLVASLTMPLVAHWAAQIPWLPDKDTFVVTGSMWSSHIVRDNAPPVSIRARAYVSRQPDAEVPPQAAPDPRPAHSYGVSRFPAPTIAHTISDTAPAPAAPARASTPLFERVRDRMAWPGQANALLLLYLTVAGVLLFRICLGAWAALRLWWHAQPVRFDVPSGVRVRSSRAIASPVTVAAGIVLPADYTGWDTEKLRIVLAHECSHVRQRDFILQLAAALYVALFWFNPLGWWLKRKLTDLSETISDGAAVHQAASHASYAQVLLEFAALPRPVTIGVAMAHRGHLRSRIEHLLNENNFRQAFSGGRARLAAAVLLVPVALFGATAMVRVHAAAQQTPSAPATVPDPAQAPQAAPLAPPSPDSPAKPPAAGSTFVPDGAPPMPPPPPPPSDDNFSQGPGSSVGPGSVSAQIDGAIAPYAMPDVVMLANGRAMVANAQVRAMAKADMARVMALKGRGFAFDFGNDGNSYAYVTGEGEKGVHYSGGWFDGSRDEIDKARKVARGDFLWFERDGKSYVIDDAATMASLKPMQDQMDDLGKQQEALGKQQEELGKQQEALGKQMEQLKVPTPDMQKELQKLQAVQAKLAAIQGKDASRQQLGEIESELAEVQGQLGALQGQMGGREGDLGGKMGELGGQQGKLGAEQGRLGAQQGRIAREMDGKVLTIIDESLKDGKARPVQ